MSEWSDEPPGVHRPPPTRPEQLLWLILTVIGVAVLLAGVVYVLAAAVTAGGVNGIP